MLEQEIAEMSQQEVEIQLALAKRRNHDPLFIEAWVNRLIDCCYDRIICRALGVDYPNVDTKENMNKVKLYAYHKELEYHERRS